MTDSRRGKRALLTGATGFVGSHLAKRLECDGWEVHAVIRPHSSVNLLREILPDIILHPHEGTTEEMSAIVGAVKPDVVFHLASLFLAEHRAGDIEPMLRSNVLFGAQLLEAMHTYGAYRLINTGTAWQHYEGKAYSPVCLYAASKQAFESILQYYTEATPLRAITLKLFDTYGPSDPRRKLLAALKRLAAEREPTPMAMSPGEQLIDLVYIDDVVEAFLVAAKRIVGAQPHSCEAFAISSGQPVKLRDLVEKVEAALGRKLPVRWGERAYRSREVMIPWTEGRALPGWLPGTGLEEGMRKVFLEEKEEGNQIDGAGA